MWLQTHDSNTAITYFVHQQNYPQPVEIQFQLRKPSISLQQSRVMYDM